MTDTLLNNKTPRIYVYTEPQYENTEWTGKNNRHGKGLLKVGYTERTVKERIEEQRVKQPVKNPYTILLDEPAIRANGTYFKDYDIHKRLREFAFQYPDSEWFECTVEEVREVIYAVKNNKNEITKRIADFEKRPEQAAAVKLTSEYFRRYSKENENGRPPHFLWNAKMRFGKTFTTYQLAKEMNWNKVLILTFKPAVKHSWKEDLLSHVDFEGWQFISKDEIDTGYHIDKTKPYVRFASFQDVLQKTDAGGIKPHNTDIHLTEWDCIVLDEYHFGAWNKNSKDLYDKEDDAKYKERKELSKESGDIEVDYYDEELISSVLNTKNYLYLSGTPFRALNEGEFSEKQLFNWTYTDEQKAKKNWKGPGKNPYLELPQMKLYTYKMPAEIEQIALKGEFNEFDLNEFFNAQEVDKWFKFKHETEVKNWLNLIRGQYLASSEYELKAGGEKPFLPFSNFINKLNHTFWFLPSVASCKAMGELLKNHTFYKEYEIVVCAGNEAGIGEDALKPVEKAIKNGFETKTITLSCGKLTTGVTVPQWSGIFMLRNTSSPETYFQSAFRVQSPWVEKKPNGEREIIKNTCYVFDFAPTRALKNIRDYCDNLIVNSDEKTEEKIKEFLEFLPVLCYDNGCAEYIKIDNILQYILTGTTSTMLARKWECAQLVCVETDVLEKLFENEEAMRALSNIESFRNSRDFNLGKSLDVIISSAESIKKTKQEKTGDFSKEERKELSAQEKEFKSKRKEIQDKLKKLATRIPIFMYLTDHREISLMQVIESIEPDLFKKVTGLTVSDFNLLKSIGIFNEANMNKAVLGFKIYEDDSLEYTGINKQDKSKDIGR